MSDEFTILKWRESLTKLLEPDFSIPSVPEFEVAEITDDIRTQIKRTIAVIDAISSEENYKTELIYKNSQVNGIAKKLGYPPSFVLNVVTQWREMRDTFERARDPSLGDGFSELPSDWTT